MTTVQVIETIFVVFFWVCYFVAGWDAVNATFGEYHILYRIALVPIWVQLYVFAMVGEKLHIL